MQREDRAPGERRALVTKDDMMRSSTPTSERSLSGSLTHGLARTLVLGLLAAAALGVGHGSQAGAVTGEAPSISIQPPAVDIQVCAKSDPNCGAKLNIELEGAIKSPEPKCVGFPNFEDPANCPRQTLGAFSVELRYDAKLVNVSVTRGPLLNRPEVTCMTIPNPGAFTFGCVTKGKPADTPTGPGTLASVRVTPKGNFVQKSVTTPLLSMRCQIADLQGHGIPFGACDDASITVRQAPDSDKDGCSDGEEKGNNPNLGGRRNVNNFWDFFDTPAGAGRNKTVSVEDIVGVVGRFGSTGNPAASPMTAPPPAPGYHTAFDRRDDPSSTDGWRLLSPDGAIAVADIVAAAAQFGHNCQAAP